MVYRKPDPVKRKMGGAESGGFVRASVQTTSRKKALGVSQHRRQNPARNVSLQSNLRAAELHSAVSAQSVNEGVEAFTQFNCRVQLGSTQRLCQDSSNGSRWQP